MARLYRPTITRYTDPATGKRCRKDAPGAVRTPARSRTWRGEWRDGDGVLRTKALSPNKAAAKAMLREVESEAERGRAGLTNPFAEHARTPLADHLADFRAHLEAKGNGERHVHDTTARVRAALIEGCGFRLIGDLSASRLAADLADRRAEGLGVATSNHYLTACKGFTRWMVKDRRSSDDPFAHLSKLNADADVRKERRDLCPVDFARVLDAAEAGPVRSGLTGPDRAMLYRTAAYTGLRASELASLTPRSFDFTADPPTVTVEAACSKRRRRDVLPLHPDLADRLRAWFEELDRHRAAADAPATLRIDGEQASEPARLWPSNWATGGKYGAAAMLRFDLEAAGVPYTDADGRDFDFHALRHQFITMLARSGVHPKDAQALARHSTITLTMDRYTHVGLRDMGAAVASLPGMQAVPGSAVATGTDGGGNDPNRAADARRHAPGGSVVAGMVAGPNGNPRGRTGTAGETSTGERPAAGPGGRMKKPPVSQGAGDDRGRLGTAEQSRRKIGGGGNRTHDTRIMNPLL